MPHQPRHLARAATRWNRSRPMKLLDFFSLKSQMAFGFAVAALPLLAAVLLAASALCETAKLDTPLAHHVFEQTKAVGLVLQKTSDLERKARLFVLLDDPALRSPYERSSYEAVRVAFKQALDGLLGLAGDNRLILLAKELAEKEDLIYRHIIKSEADTPLKFPLDDAFTGLRETSANLSREFENQIKRELDARHSQTQARFQTLLAQAGLLTGLSVLLAGALLAFLGRSLRSLNAAIERLGAGDFAEPIRIAGPSDLVRLGGILESLRSRWQPPLAPAQDLAAAGTPMDGGAGGGVCARLPGTDLLPPSWDDAKR